MADEKRGLFQRLREGLTRSRDSLGGKVDQLVTATADFDDEFFEDLTDVLIQADVGVKTSQLAVERLRGKISGQRRGDPAQAKQHLIDVMVEIMKDEPMRLETPMVLLIIGVNGVGKTTSVGKLAVRFKLMGRRVIICAGDTFRAAAADQLEIWSQRAEVPIIRQHEGADPAAVVFDAVSAAKARNADVLIVDTAGRLHNKAHLMEELRKMARVVAREFPAASCKALLVVEATTGQNALSQAAVFRDVTELDGIILTKLDGTARGGVALAIRSELGLPVRYVGIGERIDDMQPFDARQYIEALF